MAKNIQRRLTAARNRAFGAKAVFTSLANELEESAKAANAVAVEAQAVVSEHQAVALDAITHANEAREKADRIRGLLDV